MKTQSKSTPLTPACYSVNQAAQILSVSPAAIRNMIRRRAIAVVQLGARLTRIRAADLEEFINRSVRPASGEVTA
jgi:excisionase family DNA binding protein